MDLVTRLLLETKMFDDNIKKSAGQIASFENNVRTIGSSVLKFAGGLGIAMTAGEALNKVIQSSQGTSDKYEATIAGLTGTVNTFFQALSTGDFSSFDKGMERVYDRAKKVAEAMDYLGDVMAGWGVAQSEIRNKIDENLNIIRDPESTKSQISDAIKENRTLLSQIQNDTKTVTSANRDAALSMFKQWTGNDSATWDDAYRYAIDTNLKRNEAQLTAGKEVMKKYEDAISKSYKVEYETVGSGMNVRTNKINVPTDDTRRLQSEFDKYKKENASLMLDIKAENNITDENREKMLGLIMSVMSADQNVNALTRSVLKGEKTASKGAKSEQAEIKTKAKAAVELQDLDQKNIDGIRKELQEKLGKIGDAPLELAMPIKYVESEEQSDIKGSIADKESQLQALYIAYNESTNADLRKIYAQRIRDAEDALNKMHSSTEDGMVDIADSLNNLIENSIITSFQTLGDAIGSGDFGGAMREGLIALMGMLEQFGAALIATGIASDAFKKVFVNPIAAIVAGSALIITAGIAKSALSRATDFADGGIVYGETFARVGEYAGANTNPEVIAPLNKLKDILGDRSGGGELRLAGEFKIRGKDLVYIIDKQTRYNNRT